MTFHGILTQTVQVHSRQFNGIDQHVAAQYPQVIKDDYINLKNVIILLSF